MRHSCTGTFITVLLANFILINTGKCFVSFVGDDGELINSICCGYIRGVIDALSGLVNTYSKTATDLLTFFDLRIGCRERSYLKDIRIIPTNAESRMREDELNAPTLIQRVREHPIG